LIPIRIQNFRLNTDPDPGFDDQKLKKIPAKKNTIYLSLGLQKGRPSYRRSLSSQGKFLNLILLLLVIFALLDPDSGYGSTDMTESGSNPDPDPKQCNE
jgi:hypothetical protein